MISLSLKRVYDVNHKNWLSFEIKFTHEKSDSKPINSAGVKRVIFSPLGRKRRRLVQGRGGVFFCLYRKNLGLVLCEKRVSLYEEDHKAEWLL
jgi:hypothetical protein